MVVTGVGNNNYAPDKNMTRAEFAAIMVRALGLEPETGASGFVDVAAKDWYSSYIRTAASYGIVAGYNNGNFGPNDTITREQAMTMIARAVKITGLDAKLTDGETSRLLSAFSDGASASAYAKESIAACLKTGITSGTSAVTVSPKADISRAEVAVMVQRLLQKSNLI
jgi:roadblock/LC7 domain-containing protein